MYGLAHLNALRAFEAAARNGSYIAAARELNVTPSAVGQQVRALEAWLGVRLFERSKAGTARLTPTTEAVAVLPDLKSGLERMSSVLQRLREGGGRDVLTVTATDAFMTKWLMPRIELFQAEHPGIDLRLDVSDRLADFSAGGPDVGIRYGEGPWSGLASTRLLDEEVFPVCSPALLSGAAAPRGPEDLRAMC